MKIMRLCCFFVLGLFFISGSDLMASDLRCGPKIISVGNYKYDVLKRCGDPSNVEAWEEVRIKRDFGSGPFSDEKVLHLRSLPVEELITIEEWEYNLGPNTFIRYLRFENGRLKKIKEGDYGY